MNELPHERVAAGGWAAAACFCVLVTSCCDRTKDAVDFDDPCSGKRVSGHLLRTGSGDLASLGRAALIARFDGRLYMLGEDGSATLGWECQKPTGEAIPGGPDGQTSKRKSSHTTTTSIDQEGQAED